MIEINDEGADAASTSRIDPVKPCALISDVQFDRFHLARALE